MVQVTPKKQIVITGGLGFIGFNFIKHIMTFVNPDQIIVVDKETYASNNEAKDFFYKHNITWLKIDLANYNALESALRSKSIEGIFHFAAESHVDNSINNPGEFVQSNIVGTYNLLEISRKYFNDLIHFIYVGTDEVYGSLNYNSDSSKETDILHPRSPYSASKAAAEMLCISYLETYKLPVTRTRCCNNFGLYQHTEKLIPKIITKLRFNQNLPIYGKGDNIREWIHVVDHCRALSLIYTLLPGQCINIGSGYELTNLQLAQLFLEYYQKRNPSNTSQIEFVTDRLGHDLRYSIDCSTLKETGWHTQYSEFNDNILNELFEAY